jgi:hypothetical protein
MVTYLRGLRDALARVRIGASPQRVARSQVVDDVVVIRGCRCRLGSGEKPAADR